jgi:hypothetical protein
MYSKRRIQLAGLLVIFYSGKMIFPVSIRISSMETKTEQQFTHWSYEMTAAQRKFDNMVVGAVTTFFATNALLLVDFFQIPYVLTGILPYVINLGLLLIPVFGLGILVNWKKTKTTREAYETARLQLIHEIHSQSKIESR